MLPWPASLTLGIKSVALAAVIGMCLTWLISQKARLAESKNQIAEMQNEINGLRVAIDMQALAAKYDAEKFDAMAAEAQSKAKHTMLAGKQQKRAGAVPGAGHEVMNKWLADSFRSSASSQQ